MDGVVGMTDLVESMHRNISGLAPIVGVSREGPTKGITGLVYRSVRGVSRAVGIGLDAALAGLAPVLDGVAVSRHRDTVVAALNGVLGDYLAASENPLAVEMRLRQDGQPLTLDRAALTASVVEPASKILVLVHGLCMSDLQWNRQGHDHGAVLARELGYTPLYLHYNSGRHIGINGRELAGVLDQLARTWPVPVGEIVIVGHSMGGLVARAACHYARVDGHAWLRSLRKLAFLGTPHHGAPLERAGSGLDAVLGWSPYTAPFARLGKVRSAGVQDLRHGNIVTEDSAGPRAGHAREPRMHVPLPEGVPCLAIAATKQKQRSRVQARLRGDGLVPVRSALGEHADLSRDLGIPASHKKIVVGLDHFGLLASPKVSAQLLRWLDAGVSARQPR